MTTKIQITTEAGLQVEARAPVIVSASRSTDIPAFYARWFINRLKAGYVVWYNPFNGQALPVSFKNTRAVVFWSKNPRPLMPYLKELNDLGLHFYFQFTLNDYVREGFEPNVPPLSERIETFKALAETIGREKVIWRFDPLIVTPRHTPRDLLGKIWNLGNQLKGYTDKLVFSFVEVAAYRKVQNNLKLFFNRTKVEPVELDQAQKMEIVEGLVEMRERWRSENWNLALASCAERMDLDHLGIKHNRCIDGDLMKRIFGGDTDLMYYLSYGRLPDPNKALLVDEPPGRTVNLKDKGQRKACGCIISKDIGRYDTCPHYCIYCYANSSKETVEKNLARHNVEKESIVPGLSPGPKPGHRPGPKFGRR